MSAKKEETRDKRLAALIEHSAHGLKVPAFDRDVQAPNRRRMNGK